VSLRFLLDTNVISEPARLFPNPRLVERLEENRGKMGIAAPSWHELLFGCERLPRSRKRDRIEEYLFSVVLDSFPVLPYDQAAAAWHATERARLQAAGSTPPFLDGQIAAVAGVNNLVLVTANGSDFAGFEGLRIEDWTIHPAID
jgi:tRNA(fMet)-specific endonuclease VapC